jgi:hypothetical protein
MAVRLVWRHSTARGGTLRIALHVCLIGTASGSTQLMRLGMAWCATLGNARESSPGVMWYVGCEHYTLLTMLLVPCNLMPVKPCSVPVLCAALVASCAGSLLRVRAAAAVVLI